MRPLPLTTLAGAGLLFVFLVAAPASGAEAADLPSPELLPVTKKLHALVLETAEKASGKGHENYLATAPKAKEATLSMVAIPGGKLPLDETRSIQLSPFWISAIEVPWSFYSPYYQNSMGRNKNGTLLQVEDDTPLVDVVSQPTPQYHDMFLSGKFANTPDYPAMNMTHHAASKFCQWLTAQTGQFHRLPTEAEWEYACRAGTTTAYSFGDDEGALDAHAWYFDNSEETYHPTGQKKPNAWGLYDMHGNLAEWVLDGVDPDFRKGLADGARDPWSLPTSRYPRLLKGGSWDDDPEDLRVTARKESNKQWKMIDPQVPKSVWYYTGGQHVGFRVVRPTTIPSVEDMHRMWNSDWWSPERNAEDL